MTADSHPIVATYLDTDSKEIVPRATRSRGFCFTDFKLDEGAYTKWKGEAKYIIIGREVCPESKRDHWQGSVWFQNPRSLDSVRKELPGRHLEACRGTPEQNKKYCEKDGNLVFEVGVPPQQGKRSDLEAAALLIQNGSTMKEIASSFPTQFIRYGRGMRDLQATLHPQQSRTWKTKVICLWGETGTGKTRQAVEAGATIVTYSNGKWLNYSNEETVLFDDFDPETMTREYFLKLTDRYGFVVDVKYGEKQWNPKTIYITSNTDPRSWYNGDAAVRRRLDEITHFTEPFRQSLNMEDSDDPIEERPTQRARISADVDLTL